jgi:hypothetical protein
LLNLKQHVGIIIASLTESWQQGVLGQMGG